MIESVVLSGNEERVSERIAELFDFGASEIIVSIVAAGADAACLARTHPCPARRTGVRLTHRWGRLEPAPHLIRGWGCWSGLDP